MSDTMIGARLGNYQIVQALGRGGMARVYLGHDLALNRPVAIKVIEPELRETGSYTARFRQEAQAIAALEHPHIVPVHYFGKQDALYYLVMKFIEGEDLATLLERYAGRGEYLPTSDILGIIDAVGQALDYAHSRGVIHRDIKPSNVMIDVDGRPYLTDFGLALNVSRGTVGEVIGTPHYVAPEQAQNSADAVPQSDLYSLGVMLFEMFTGVVPFDDPTPTAVALQHIMQEPPAPRALNPDLPPSIEHVILRTLAKQPAERYQTGADITEALDKAIRAAKSASATAPLPALPPLPPGMTPPARRHTSTQSIAAEVRTTLAARPPLQPPPAIRRTPEKAAPTRHAFQQAQTVEAPPARRRRFPLIAIVLLMLVAIVVIAVVVITGQPGDTTSEVPQVAQLPTATVVSSQTDLPPSITPAPTDTALPSQTPPPTATFTALMTDTPLPIITSPPPTNPPAPTTVPQVVGPTAAPANWLPVSFTYTSDAFYWLNNAGVNISVQHIAFEQIGGTERFEGHRWAYWTMEAGRCMELVFADVSVPPRPEGCRPNAWFTPTRTQGVGFWTGGGQFRVLWQGQEIAICEISAGQCSAFVPPN